MRKIIQKVLDVTSSSKMSKATPTLIADTDLHSHIAETVQQLNSEITPDNPIAPYLEAYNSMFTKFDEAYERNLKLVRLCHEMNSTVILNANKISETLKYTKETSDIIESLRAEYEKAKRRLKMHNERAKEKLSEFQKLRDEYNEIRQAVKPSEEFIQQIEESQQAFSNVQEQIETTTQLLDEIQSENEWLKSELSKIESEIENYERQRKDIQKEKLNIDNEIAMIESSIQNLSDEKDSNEGSIDEFNERIELLNRSIKDSDLQFNSIKTETNSIKTRMAKLPKDIREQKKLLQVNLEQKHYLESQLNKKSDKFVELNQELQTISKEAEVNLVEFNNLTKQRRQNQQEKDQLLEKNSKLRTQLLNLQISVTRQTNENRTNNRVLINEKVFCSNQKKDFQDEIQTAREINNVTRNIVYETTQKKQNISSMQEKLSNLESDIMNRTVEMNDTNQKISNLQDQILNNTIENENKIAAHNELKQRIEEQAELNQKLTQERNSFKRQYENIISQHNELASQYESLTSAIEMMTDKVDRITEETIASKIKKEEANIASESLEKMRITALQGIERSKNSTQKLKAEQKTLSCVIEDTEKHLRQQEMEYRLMNNNYIMLWNQYELKNRKKDQLYSEKESIEAYRHKSEQMFNEKMNEIFNLQDQLQEQQEQQKILQLKARHANELIREKNRCLDLIAVERKKKMYLYHLSSNQIHISPYTMIYSTSIDGEEGLNHAYAINLNQRIVDAIQELDSLKKTRDELARRLKEKKERISSEYSVEDVKKYIDVYNEDLKMKEEEIEKCREMIRRNKEKASQSKEKNEQARLAVSYRKCVTQQLRQTNMELRKKTRNSCSNDQCMKPQTDSLDLSYITEPSSYMYQQSSSHVRNRKYENDASKQNQNVPRLRLNQNYNESQPPPMIQSQRYQPSLNPKIRIPKAERSPRYYRKYAMK